MKKKYVVLIVAGIVGYLLWRKFGYILTDAVTSVTK